MRNNRLAYNLSGIMRMLSPRFLLPSREKILHSIKTRDDIEYIKQRVDYYCQLDSKITLDENAKNISCVRLLRKRRCIILMRMNLHAIFRRILGHVLNLAI